MSDNSKPNKAIAGNLFMKDLVALPSTTDPETGEVRERSMAVLWVQTEDDTVRVTDFSTQHEALELDAPIRVVYTETQKEEANGFVKTHRNLVSASQA